MKVSYLRKVLRAGLGTTFSEDTRLEFRNKPSSLWVQLQTPLQNLFPFSGTLWENENEPEDVKQKFESARRLPKPTTNANGEIKAATFSQDNPLSIQQKVDVGFHGATEINMGRPDVKRREKEAKEDKGELQDIEDKVDIQEPEVRSVQRKEGDRIPKIEVIKQDGIRVPRLDQLRSASPVSQLVGINSPSQELNKNKQVQQLKESSSQKHESRQQLQPRNRRTRIAKPQKERIRIPLGIAKQEKIDESETRMEAIEAIQKPLSQQDLNAHFFTESLKKSETQINKIAREVTLIAKKLDKHVINEEPEPTRPVLLPKRPASHNLGGWSDLERNYIR